jgi:hypothetical protein
MSFHNVTQAVMCAFLFNITLLSIETSGRNRVVSCSRRAAENYAHFPIVGGREDPYNGHHRSPGGAPSGREALSILHSTAAIRTFPCRENWGLRCGGVVGLMYEIPRSPFDGFMEIAPLLIIFSPASGVGIDAALGVRIYP